MTRTTLAKKFLSEFDEEKDEKNSFLLVYDFHGVKPQTTFYRNLNEILSGFKYEKVQLSTLRLYSAKCTKAIKQLIRHYRGETRIFEIKREISYST